jgi:hypothetical protein
MPVRLFVTLFKLCRVAVLVVLGMAVMLGVTGGLAGANSDGTIYGTHNSSDERGNGVSALISFRPEAVSLASLNDPISFGQALADPSTPTSPVIDLIKSLLHLRCSATKILLIFVVPGAGVFVLLLTFLLDALSRGKLPTTVLKLAILAISVFSIYDGVNQAGPGCGFGLG